MWWPPTEPAITLILRFFFGFISADSVRCRMLHKWFLRTNSNVSLTDRIKRVQLHPINSIMILFPWPSSASPASETRKADDGDYHSFFFCLFPIAINSTFSKRDSCVYAVFKPFLLQLLFVTIVFDQPPTSFPPDPNSPELTSGLQVAWIRPHLSWAFLVI